MNNVVLIGRNVRDIAEVMYESVMQRVYATKLELQILDNQYRMTMKGE